MQEVEVNRLQDLHLELHP